MLTLEISSMNVLSDTSLESDSRGGSLCAHFLFTLVSMGEQSWNWRLMPVLSVSE